MVRNIFKIINFEKQIALQTLFDADLSPQQIIEDLCFHLQTTIDIHNDLVIFDEIQACSNALTSLKYFCEDMPELVLCSADILLLWPILLYSEEALKKLDTLP